MEVPERNGGGDDPKPRPKRRRASAPKARRRPRGDEPSAQADQAQTTERPARPEAERAEAPEVQADGSGPVLESAAPSKESIDAALGEIADEDELALEQSLDRDAVAAEFAALVDGVLEQALAAAARARPWILPDDPEEAARERAMVAKPAGAVLAKWMPATVARFGPEAQLAAGLFAFASAIRARAAEPAEAEPAA